MIFQVLYHSVATKHCSAKEIGEILKVSRQNNEDLGITGILVLIDDQFLQFIEGPMHSVMGLMKSIKKDPRHMKVRVLMEQPSTKRAFSDWSMAYMEKTPAEIIKLLKNEKATSLDEALSLMESSQDWVGDFIHACQEKIL